MIYIGVSSPLWRPFNRRLADLFVIHVYGANPFENSCWKSTMKPVRKVIRREEIEFILRLHGLWEGIVKFAPLRPSTSTPWSSPNHLGWSSRSDRPDSPEPESTGSTVPGILMSLTLPISTKA